MLDNNRAKQILNFTDSYTFYYPYVGCSTVSYNNSEKGIIIRREIFRKRSDAYSKLEYYRYENRKDLGNTQTGDGIKYAGRGHVQITGKANYSKFSNKLGLGILLVNNPDLALRKDISLKILIKGCIEGLFTGKKLYDYIKEGSVNYKEVIDRVEDDYIETDSNGNEVVRISEEVAETKFNDHIKRFEDKVRDLNVDFYQWEFDAMVSLFFNMGSLEKAPSLKKHLNNGEYTKAGKEFNDITNSDTTGLVYRRAAEMDMFLNGNESYISFKNNNETERDKLVDKLNEIRQELGRKQFNK